MNDISCSSPPPRRVSQRAADLDQWSDEDLEHPALYLNRELSLLSFNHRVLKLARNPRVPLLERLRFLCISCTNLDEFFEVRVAAVRQRDQHGANQPGPDGLSPRSTLEAIREATQELVAEQYVVLNDELTPALTTEGIRILRRGEWNKTQRAWLYRHFTRELLPVLSPLGLDPAHPFPRILNKSLNFAVELDGRDAFGRETNMALVRAPRSLPRIIRIPESHSAGPDDYVFLSSILHEFMADLFPGMTVRGCYQFRVTRNSELFVDEEEIEDLARALQGELLERGFAEAIRLEIATNCPAKVVNYLASKFGLADQAVYTCDGPVNMNRMIELYELVDRPELKYPPFQPRLDPQLGSGSNIFSAIRARDWLMHHPYDSFQPVLELLHQAVTDPDVLAIKQTLYRTGAESTIVSLLVEAARAGKDVTVVVELRARFDEEANITLATRLQEAGVQVVYGVVGHKTHAKMLLVVRRERGRLRRYVHLGTGNYHQGTTKAYTDWGLLTFHKGICEDVHRIFQQLSGLGSMLTLDHLVQSPFRLRAFLLESIDREAANARAGKPARICAKLNALTEPEVIRSLYRASRAGVEIDLIIRGICCLRPGLPGLSENIRVRSIIGRFLEHSRIYYFHNGGKPKTWCSSADWMGRNLFQRVEAAFPILHAESAQRLFHESFELAREDRSDAWVLESSGDYVQPEPDDPAADISSQEQLIRLAAENPMP